MDLCWLVKIDRVGGSEGEREIHGLFSGLLSSVQHCGTRAIDSRELDPLRALKERRLLKACPTTNTVAAVSECRWELMIDRDHEMR